MANRKGKRESNDKFYIFLAFKITVDGDFSLKLKDTCFFQRKAKTNLDNLLKIRQIILLTKVWHSQSYGFSSSHVQMWELKAEHQRTDAFE